MTRRRGSKPHSTTDSCRRFRGLSLDRYYGELDPGEADGLNAHLAECGPCRLAESDWLRIGGLLSTPELAHSLAQSASEDRGSGLKKAAFLAGFLGGLTMLASLAPLLARGSHVRLEPFVLVVAACLWTLAYQVLFTGLLAEYRRERLPVDVRTVLFGLLVCEGAVIVTAVLLLALPLLNCRLAETVRLSLPDLLTALSGSMLLAIGAVLGIRRHFRAGTHALAIALVHGLLLVPSRLLIHPSAAGMTDLLQTAAFLLGCAALGSLLGWLGSVAERMKLSGTDWNVEPA